jgi:hypothetical protein
MALAGGGAATTCAFGRDDGTLRAYHFFLALNLTDRKQRDAYKAVINLVEDNGGVAYTPIVLTPISDYMLDGSPATILAIRRS